MPSPPKDAKRRFELQLVETVCTVLTERHIMKS